MQKFDPSEHILEKHKVRDAAIQLANLPGTVLHTLLMHVFAQRTAGTEPKRIASLCGEERLTIPCPVDQRDLVEADAIAYRILGPAFRAIECSPVSPLGANSALAGVNQKNVLATIRGVEVIADPTIVLALEASQYRRILLGDNIRSTERVALATSGRSLRLQHFDDIPGFVPHFKAFALATAGRDIGHESFEKESLAEHMTFYLDYLTALTASGRYTANNIRLYLSDVRIMESIITVCALDRAAIGRNTQKHGFSAFREYGVRLPGIVAHMDMLPREGVSQYRLERPRQLLDILWTHTMEPLRQRYPHVEFLIDLDRAAGIGYYTNACFKITAENIRGVRYPLVDGGLTDWTQKLVPSRKERLLVSGMGTELFCTNFRSAAIAPLP